MQKVVLKDLGQMEYQQAWDYQEALLQENVRVKAEARQRKSDGGSRTSAQDRGALPVRRGTAPSVRRVAVDGVGWNENRVDEDRGTTHYLLLVEHPPVYTLGKSGHIENVLIDEAQMGERGIGFFRTNRGGDITFHGPGQLVGYPILDLERFYTDIGRYLRNLEEVTIAVLAGYGIRGERSVGETGVWIEPGVRGRERKICAIGVRCSRWVTMHGFALNVNTDLGYFGNIVPCGIQDKQVTSLQKELGHLVPLEEVKAAWMREFENVFGVELV